jgi:hypothetical protein
MIMSDEWESPNSKVVDYGAYALAGILIWLGLVFYPAVVVGIQVGNAYDTFDEGVMPGTIAAVITLVAIVLLWAGAKAGSPICWFLVIGLYVICLLLPIILTRSRFPVLIGSGSSPPLITRHGIGVLFGKRSFWTG